MSRWETLTWGEVDRAIRESGMSPSGFAHAAGVPPLSVGLLRKGKPITDASRKSLTVAVWYWEVNGNER